MGGKKFEFKSCWIPEAPVTSSVLGALLAAWLLTPGRFFMGVLERVPRAWKVDGLFSVVILYFPAE
jgi:hypothetical protein